MRVIVIEHGIRKVLLILGITFPIIDISTTWIIMIALVVENMRI